MAKKAAPKDKKKDAAPKGAGGVNKLVVIGLLVAVVPFSLPTCMVLGAGMLPTLGAYASEKGDDRYAFLCVGGVNFAVLVPYLLGMWFGVHSIDEATRLLTESSMLLWSYLAASVGWIIYKAMPPIISNWLAMNTNRRINGLRAAQRKLIDDWGDGVIPAGVSPPPSVKK